MGSLRDRWRRDVPFIGGYEDSYSEDEEMSKFVKNPDEIILQDIKMFHYEVMEEGRAVWLGIYLNNGKIYHMNIGGDNVWVTYSEESL